MSARGHAARAVALLAFASLHHCLGRGGPPPTRETTVCEYETVCVETGEVLVTQRTWDFDALCVGPSCGVVGEGAVSIGPSFHPAQSALHIGAGGVASLRFTVNELANGASISMNARCDEGARLSFDGDGACDASQSLAGGTAWRRVDRLLCDATRRVDVSRDAGLVTRAAALRLSVRGSGACVVDRLIYRVSGLVCTRSGSVATTCSTVTEWDQRDAGRGDAATTGAGVDASDARDDARVSDASDDADASD